MVTQSPSRPLSPHLQIWRFTVTMATSITHRATGAALYAGTILLVCWLATAAFSPEGFAAFQGFMDGLLGKIILIGYSWAISFHLLNGLRYLFWDAGRGFELDTANATAWLAYAGSILFTCLLWAAAIYFA